MQLQNAHNATSRKTKPPPISSNVPTQSLPFSDTKSWTNFKPHQTMQISGSMVFMDLMFSYLFHSQPLVYFSATEWYFVPSMDLSICTSIISGHRSVFSIACQMLQKQRKTNLTKYSPHCSKILCHIHHIYTLLNKYICHIQNFDSVCRIHILYVQDIYFAHQIHMLLTKYILRMQNIYVMGTKEILDAWNM